MQLVTLRLEAAALVSKAQFTPDPDSGPSAEAARIGDREVYLPELGGMVACPVYLRDSLRAGNRLKGPAIIEQMDTTTVLLADMTAYVDPFLNLVLEFN